MYYNMSAENASKYVELLTQFYPNTMSKATYPVETLKQTISYKGVEFEIVERPDVIWAGCADYAENNTDEPDIGAALKRFQALVESSPIKEKINPGWSASLSINYGCNDKPCGIMFANESYTDKQDERYDVLTQPGGLWLRVCVNAATDTALLGRQNYGIFEYFGILKDAAQENGYLPNPNVHIEIEYHCHAEYDAPPHTAFAYIPIFSTGSK